MQAALIGPSGQIILGPAGLTIGRMQSNQYVVYDRRVSARHAVISFLKQGYFTITDIGSTNGTFVNGQLLTHNAPHILHSGDTICIDDTILTFQISDQFPNLPHDISPLNETSPTWEDSATDRYARVKYRTDVNYPFVESQKKQAPFEPNYVENNTIWQATPVTPSQKVDEIPALAHAERSIHKIGNPSTQSRRKILVSILLIGLILLGVIAAGTFEYLNRSTPDRTLDNFCTALHSRKS